MRRHHFSSIIANLICLMSAATTFLVGLYLTIARLDGGGYLHNISFTTTTSNATISGWLVFTTNDLIQPYGTAQFLPPGGATNIDVNISPSDKQLTASLSFGVSLASASTYTNTNPSTLVISSSSSSTGISSSSSLGSSSAVSSSSPPPVYTGVQATNNVDSSYGLTTWTGMTSVGSYAVGNRVRVAWVTTPSDYMEGCITAITLSPFSITVNADVVNGATNVPWTPWMFSFISLICNITSSSSSTAPSSISSSSSSSSGPLPPSNSPLVSVVAIGGQSNCEGAGYFFNASLDTYNGSNLFQYVIGDQCSQGIPTSACQPNSIMSPFLAQAGMVVPFTAEPMIDAWPQNTSYPYISFAMSFSQNWLAANPSRSLVVINGCVGGTAFANGWWVPPSDVLFTRLVNARLAVKALYPNSTDVGLLWDDGENDVGSFSTAISYQTVLASFFSSYRSSTSLPYSPVIVLSLNPYWIATQGSNGAIIQSVLANVSCFTYNSSFVWGAGAPGGSQAYSDVAPAGIAHYNAVAQRINGFNLYQAWAQLPSSSTFPTNCYSSSSSSTAPSSSSSSLLSSSLLSSSSIAVVPPLLVFNTPFTSATQFTDISATNAQLTLNTGSNAVTANGLFFPTFQHNDFVEYSSLNQNITKSFNLSFIITPTLTSLGTNAAIMYAYIGAFASSTNVFNMGVDGHCGTTAIFFTFTGSGYLSPSTYLCSSLNLPIGSATSVTLQWLVPAGNATFYFNGTFAGTNSFPSLYTAIVANGNPTHYCFGCTYTFQGYIANVTITTF